MKPNEEQMKRVIVSVLALLGVVFLFTMCSSPSRSSDASTSPAPVPGSLTIPAPAPAPTSKGPLTEFDEGNYEVGVDIKPGKYKTKGPSTEGFSRICYYSREKTGDGSMGDIIDNNISEGPSTVTIKESDGYFETNGCQTWTKVN